MRIKLEIKMDSAAFEDDWRQETARILTHAGALLRNLAEPGDVTSLHDSNGNKVGDIGLEK